MSRRLIIALRILSAILIAASVAGQAHMASAQRFGTPSTSPMPAATAPSLQGAPSLQSGASSPGTPLTQLSPAPPRSVYATPNPPSAFLGNPTYDPYNNGAAPGAFQPALPHHGAIAPTAPIPGASALGSVFGGASSGATAGLPGMSPPGGYGGTNGYGVTGPTPPPAYPASIYPNAGPPVLFPGGLLGSGMGSTPGNYYNPMDEFGFGTALKFFQGPRLQHAYVHGGDGPEDLKMNETDASLAFAFPNFLYSGQPIFILPSFSVIAFEGPRDMPADLPGSVYEAFLDMGWQTDPNQILGLETGLRVGAFTDFDTFNSDSMRVQGQLLGKFRMTPRSTLKAGVIYVDRNEVGLIPAGGILYQPTPYSRWDLYFPEPKVSWYCRTIGTHDVWAYVAGEYGGGSWTITRANGDEESIDINDLRAMFGIEWGRSDLIRSGRRTGFVEAGVVFDREVVYTLNPQDNFDPGSTFVVRLGFGY